MAGLVVEVDEDQRVVQQVLDVLDEAQGVTAQQAALDFAAGMPQWKRLSDQAALVAARQVRRLHGQVRRAPWQIGSAYRSQPSSRVPALPLGFEQRLSCISHPGNFSLRVLTSRVVAETIEAGDIEVGLSGYRWRKQACASVVPAIVPTEVLVQIAWFLGLTHRVLSGRLHRFDPVNGQVSSLDDVISASTQAMCVVGDSVVASHRQSLHVYCARSLALRGKMLGHVGHIRSVVSVSDSCVATSSADTTIRLWDLHSMSATRTLTGLTTAAIQLWSLPGSLLVAVGYDRHLRIWNIDHTSTAPVAVWSFQPRIILCSLSRTAASMLMLEQAEDEDNDDSGSEDDETRRYNLYHWDLRAPLRSKDQRPSPQLVLAGIPAREVRTLFMVSDTYALIGCHSDLLAVDIAARRIVRLASITQCEVIDWLQLDQLVVLTDHYQAAYQLLDCSVFPPVHVSRAVAEGHVKGFAVYHPQLSSCQRLSCATLEIE